MVQGNRDRAYNSHRQAIPIPDEILNIQTYLKTKYQRIVYFKYDEPVKVGQDHNGDDPEHPERHTGLQEAVGPGSGIGGAESARCPEDEVCKWRD